MHSMGRFIVLVVVWYCAFGTDVRAQSDLYDLNHIVDIRLEFKEENWHESLDSLKERGHDERLVGDVTVDGKSYPSSGVRYKGNSSYFNVRNGGGRKLPFNIKVDYVKKKTKLPGGFVTLKLSNVFRDPSFLREVLSYEIAAKYMPASRANYARVYVNDSYLGLYNLTESVDDDYLKKFFGEDDGIFFKCDPSWHQQAGGNCKKGNNSSLEYLGKDTICFYPNYEIKSKKGWGQLKELTRLLHEEPEKIGRVLDVNQVLWMLAFNNVVVNLDSYTGRLCHNYYLYQDTSKVWHPVIWDLNLSFGGFRYTGIGAPLSNEAMQEMSLFLHFKEDNKLRPLIVKLLSNSHYRKIYLAHVRTLVEENFSNNWYKERAAAIQAVIEKDVIKDENRLYNLEYFKSNITETVSVGNSRIIGLTELMDKRAESIMAHPLMQKTSPTITTVTHQTADDESMITAVATDAMEVFVYYQTAEFMPWSRLSMAANEGDKWIATIPVTKGARYYIVAENKYIASLSPVRAAKEFYEI